MYRSVFCSTDFFWICWRLITLVFLSFRKPHCVSERKQRNVFSLPLQGMKLAIIFPAIDSICRYFSIFVTVFFIALLNDWYYVCLLLVMWHLLILPDVNNRSSSLQVCAAISTHFCSNTILTIAAITVSSASNLGGSFSLLLGGTSSRPFRTI